MISEIIQRFMMGFMMMVALYLYNTGETMFANIILGGMTVLVLIWAIFDFCPSLWTLKKIFKDECSKC